jgi:hypothetical protein
MAKKKKKKNSRTLKLSETEIEEKAVVEKPPRVLELLFLFSLNNNFFFNGHLKWARINNEISNRFVGIVGCIEAKSNFDDLFLF